MAFTARNLSVLAYAQGFTLWHYAAKSDSLADTTRAGFFNPVHDVLSGGDIMLISAADGGRASFVRNQAGQVATDPLN